ncbi:RNA polymerase sigma-54 factor RpoN [Labilithrix luteola]|uniref:RNA polymerase sigma-54 factor RpoN n=1 Tax=Labilithrix luteola TaxID=1391654 RepID=A0A0K1PPR4_9BACT|nr:sigma-70 family RNA polymerase sigma factor [Labilithrix luteola]AKU95518.1 RNA polymerase sigma-54 factor RpoN [Labilithrix luteola]
MHADRSDQAWIDGLRGTADTAARAALVSDLRDYLRRTLAKGFGRQLQGADLEDLTQESVLRVHQKLDSFEGQSRFTTWAATIAVNAALSELRRKRYEHVSIDEAGERADWSEAKDDTVDDEREVELLRRGIEDVLTERQREAIQAALGGLPLMELARRYDVSQGAVYKLLHDARRRLKRFLEEAREVEVRQGVSA